MKRIVPAIFALALTFAFHCISFGPGAGSVVVMSFNLRFDNPGDGPNAWPNRREMVAELIEAQNADLIGVQEALASQLADLEALLPGHDWFGAGRNADLGGEFSAVLYRTDRFELLDQDTFWLSETPSAAGSKGWDADFPRIVTWGRMRDRRTARVFYTFNTHFDHVGETARQESAKLTVRRIEAIAGHAPVVLTGDFNADPRSAPYALLRAHLTDAREASRTPHRGPDSTWNGFTAIQPGRRIDFIFVRGPITVLRHEILDHTVNGRFPSDHLPVVAEIRIH